MNTNVINFDNDKTFVSNEYLQSKKVFDAITGPIKNTSNSQVLDTENPFSVFYETG